jgi:hypothetical protein
MRFIYLRAATAAEMAGPTEMLTPLMQQHGALIATALVVLTATFPVAAAVCFGVGGHELSRWAARAGSVLSGFARRTRERLRIGRSEHALTRARRACARIAAQLAGADAKLRALDDVWEARQQYAANVYLDGFGKGASAAKTATKTDEETLNYDEKGERAVAQYVTSVFPYYLNGTDQAADLQCSAERPGRRGRPGNNRRVTFTYDRN